MTIPFRTTRCTRTAHQFPVYFLLVILFTAILSLGIILSASAQSGKRRLLIPIGGGYTDIYTGFTAAAAANARNDVVSILILPAGLASAPDRITAVERNLALNNAEQRRLEFQEACRRVAPASHECRVTLAPILTRSDAEEPDNLAFFTNALSAVFILDGDQSVAMRVLNGTPAEAALDEAYVKGAIIAGTNGGGSILSSAMLAGIKPEYTDGNPLIFGAVDVWNSAEKHGLPFAIHNAILDQQFFQQGHFGRLLNAISMPGNPHLGIGIDANTGVYIYDNRMVENVFGRNTVAILDAETYHAAQAARYLGPNHSLSLRNVLVHLLSPGYATYDLVKHRHSLAAPSDGETRSFAGFSLLPGATPIILAGDLSQDLPGSPILARFETRVRDLSGNLQGRILIVAAGYASIANAQQAAASYAAALSAPVQILAVDPQADQLEVPDTDRYAAILFVAKDQSILARQVSQLTFIKRAWQDGKPLLADNAAAAALGQYFSAHPPTLVDAQAGEAAVQGALIQGSTRIVKGLGIVNLNNEPQLITGNRWGRLFALAYNHPEIISLGIPDNTALDISPSGASVLGDKVAVTLDLRSAQLDQGINRGFVVANGMLDVFAPGERVEPVTASISASPVQAPTPDLSTPLPSLASSAAPSPSPTHTATPTETPIETFQHGRPTRTPRPTATPLLIPPPSDPVKTNQMIMVGSFVVLVIVFGILINRKHITPNGDQ
jgi:cyanophycinase